jgi:hypothetical protein
MVSLLTFTITVKQKEGIFLTETMSKMLIEIVSKTLIATNIETVRH